MNAQDADPTVQQHGTDAGDGAGAEPAAEAAKPRRRRSTRAPVAVDPAGAADPVASSPAAAPAAADVESSAAVVAVADGVALPADAPAVADTLEAAAPAAPVRRRSRKAAVTAAAADASAAGVGASPVPAAVDVASPPARPEVQPDVQQDVQQDVQSGAAPADVAGDADARPAGASEDADAEGPRGEAGEGAETAMPSEGATKRRRRRRRGGERGERAAAAEGGADADPSGQRASPDAPAGSEGSAPVSGPRPPVPAAQAVEIFAEVLSGAFDAEPAPEEGADAPRPRRVLAAEPDAPKLHKVLAQAGIGSRRDMEQMIVDGRITVNGEPAHTGQRISFGDRISVNGKPVKVRIAPPAPRVLAYHKPVGEVVTHDDPQQRPTVFRRLPRLPHGKWQSVGRLDINTEGLLLFTNSGELANQLMHPRFGVEREYAVRCIGQLGSETRARLLEGVEIEGQRAAFKSVEDGGGGDGLNHWYRVVITEGRNREVRRLFDAVGLTVSRLIRIRYGSVVLPRGLRRGAWVDLEDRDVAQLRRLAPGARPAKPAAPRDDEGAKRGKRGARRGRGPRPDGGQEAGEFASIPNPLLQTYDKRAAQQAKAQRREIPEDGPIPNPLQQTYDKRAMQQAKAQRREIPEDGPIPNPLQQTYDRRFAGKPGGASSPRGGRQGRGTPTGQPDPMRTSLGYIGADALLGKSGGRGGRPGGSRGGGGKGRRR